MPIPPALAAVLAALTAAVDDPSIEIAGTVEALSRDLTLAVDSYVGLRVQLNSAGHEVDFTVLTEVDGLSRARTSLRLSALPGSAPDAGGQVGLVFYATARGAFVDLAADVEWLIGSAGRVALDDDLPGPDQINRPDTIGELSAANQAIGVLIGRGHSIESARNELVRLSVAAGTTLAVAAAAVLGGLE